VPVNPTSSRSHSAVGTGRKVLKKFKFSNGTTVEPGEIVGTNIAALHMDDSIYKNAHEFDGFRFSRMREEKGGDPKLYATNTNLEFLQFGHGKHAWYTLMLPI
jgi:cytochrome P450